MCPRSKRGVRARTPRRRGGRGIIPPMSSALLALYLSAGCTRTLTLPDTGADAAADDTPETGAATEDTAAAVDTSTMVSFLIERY